MNKKVFIVIFCLIISAITFAQVPQKMSYQAVVRGSDNNLVTNSEVSVRVSILQGSADGEAVYTETHSATTNANGLLTIEIGDGTSSDDFSAINWANGPYFVKTETDVNGGNEYDIIGVSQLLSVPYAMYAQTAGNVPDVSGFLTEESDPTVPEWAKAEEKPQYDYSEIQNTPEIPEFQALSISNDTIFLTNGGFVKLPPAAVGFSGDYNDLTNRPEIPIVPTNVSAFENDANYVIIETDPTVPEWAKAETKPQYDYSEIQNTPEIPERQVLSISNDTIFLSDGGFVKLPPVAVGFSGDYNDLTNRPEIPTVPTNVSAFENDANYVITETDPTVPEWAKSENKPVYNYSEIEGTPEIPTVPTNVSAFENDANYVINEADPTVSAWAKTENKPVYNYSEIEGTPEIPTVPTNISAFENDANYVVNETDPTVPAWAKAESKPVYNYSEIEGTPEIPTVPTNVSAFENDANYVVNEADPTVPAWAKAENKPVYNYSEIEGTPEIPTVPTNISAFENDANYVVNETDPTVPAWAKAESKPVYNYSEIEGTPEIPTVPTNVSAFENDANYVITETDPTVPAWAKAENKPVYSYSEIEGTPEIPTVPTNVSAFENDANYVVNEADPTVPAWAKAENKPVYNYSEIEGTPEIPTVPTNVSAFENDANYITLAEVPAESQTLADVATLGNSMGNRQIKNVTDPTENQDAATKKYVDDLIATLEATVEALQNRRPIVVTFDANGGSGSMQFQVFLTGVAQTISANTFTRTDYVFAGWNTAADGGGTSYTDGQSITIFENITLYAQWETPTGTLNGHDWIDLGLPSGTRWATCNVGADNPEDYGDFFAWGETTPKTSYTENNYTYSSNSTTLPSSADAASVNWEGAWRMPTKAEFEELKNNCTVIWTTQNGVNGRLFTGPNGNSIFLPATGYYQGSNFISAGSCGYFWSSSLYTGYMSSAWNFLFTTNACVMANTMRYYGMPIRAVCQPEN